MSRLLAVLSVALVGAALVLLAVNRPADGDDAGQMHARGRTAQVVPPTGAAERGAGETSAGVDTVPTPRRPRMLVIESLGVRAPVVPLEVSGTTLYPPADPTKVGWWRDGAMPGAVRGSAIVTGHTVSDGKGVFDELDRLRTGDRIRLVSDHEVLRYVVRTEKTYRQNALARQAQQLFSQSSAGRLVLVTCEDWNGKVYLSNHVVIAEPA